jgi:hypothetical protein
MAFILNGTTGIATVDGSVSAPSQRGQDSNSGISYGANFIKFSTDGVERIAITNSGISGTGILTSGGKILQVLQTVRTSTASTAGNSYTTIADFTSTITTTGSNKVLVRVNINFGVNAGNTALFRLGRTTSGTTTNELLIGNAASSRSRVTMGGLQANAQWENNPESCEFLDSPSAGTHAYFIQWAVPSGAGTVYLNRSYRDNDNAGESRLVSTITTMEVAV